VKKIFTHKIKKIRLVKVCRFICPTFYETSGLINPVVEKILMSDPSFEDI